MTLISRVLGLVRDVVIANVMGAGVAADVFFFANKIPNFLRRLFAEGAFAQAFVPVLSEYHAKDDDKIGAETKQLIAQVGSSKQPCARCARQGSLDASSSHKL